MKIKFYSPSYKRANKVQVSRWLKSVVLAVHELEAGEYRKNQAKELLIIPDDLRGNMAKVRNFILETAFSKDKADICVMLDDDVKYVGYIEFKNAIKVSEKMLREKIEEWGQVARELDTVLFGANLQVDPKFYREYSPISFLTPVLGPFCCILKTDLRYDERLSLNEDYDFALQVLYKHRKILRWNKWHYYADHLITKGGCSAYRTLTVEKEQAGIMVKKWGSRIVKYNFMKSTNPRINCPLSGI